MNNHHGYSKTFEFKNGYSASVISHELSMGGKYGYFEVAVLHLKQGQLCYAHTEFNHPIGWLTFFEVTPLIDKIRSFGENPRCDHQREDEE